MRWLFLSVLAYVPHVFAVRTSVGNQGSFEVDNQVGLENMHSTELNISFGKSTEQNKSSVKVSKPFQVFLRILNKDEVLTYDCDETTTMRQLKDAIAAWQGWQDRPEWERNFKMMTGLTQPNKILEGSMDGSSDGRTLVSMGVESEFSIYVTGYLKGGVQNGTPLKKSTYDFVVRLSIRKGNGWYTCTGTIYGDVVWTAAHCVHSGDGLADAIEVILWNGIVYRAKKVLTATLNGVQWRPNAYGQSVDMVKLVLDGSYYPKSDILFAMNKKRGFIAGTLAGYGSTGPCTRTDSSGCNADKTLYGAVFSVDAGCQRINRYYGCARDDSGSDKPVASCGGDSGAPWFDRLDNGTFMIMGVHKGGQACNGTTNGKSDFAWMHKTREFWNREGWAPQGLWP